MRAATTEDKRIESTCCTGTQSAPQLWQTSVPSVKPEGKLQRRLDCQKEATAQAKGYCTESSSRAEEAETKAKNWPKAEGKSEHEA